MTFPEYFQFPWLFFCPFSKTRFFPMLFHECENGGRLYKADFTILRHIPLTFMMGTRGLKRDESWLRTSPNNCWCFNTLRIFMIRTMAACNKKDNYYSLRAFILQVHSTLSSRLQRKPASTLYSCSMNTMPTSAFNHCNSHTMTACKYTTIAKRIQCSLVSRLNLSRGKLP